MNREKFFLTSQILKLIVIYTFVMHSKRSLKLTYKKVSYLQTEKGPKLYLNHEFVCPK